MPTRRDVPDVPDASPVAAVVAVVLAGGTSRRWHGVDKTAADLRGRPVLAHVVGALPPDVGRVVIVGPLDHPARGLIERAAAAEGRAVTWTREVPPGGGPAAGLSAAVASLDPCNGVTTVVVLAGDLPFAGTAVPRLLAALAAGVAGVAGVAAREEVGEAVGEAPSEAAPSAPPAVIAAAIGRDPGGRLQPLLAAYRLAALRESMQRNVVGMSLRALLAGIPALEVPVTTMEALDLDTPEALADAVRVLSEGEMPALDADGTENAYRYGK